MFYAMFYTKNVVLIIQYTGEKRVHRPNSFAPLASMITDFPNFNRPRIFHTDDLQNFQGLRRTIDVLGVFINSKNKRKQVLALGIVNCKFAIIYCITREYEVV